MKEKKNNSAITLIALVITIIVLLILAGVTLNMVMGDSGLFAKAKLAKERTETAQYEEELNLTLLNMASDKMGKLDMETIIKEFPAYLMQAQPNCSYEWDTEQTEKEPVGIYKKYDFYIDRNHKAHIKEKAKGETTIEINLSTTEFTNKEVTATIKITSSVGIRTIKDKNGKEYQVNGQKEYIIKETTIENTIYKYQVTDVEGKTEEKVTQVTNIDKNPPADFTITAENTEEGLKITGETTDAESSIDRYEYYVKKSGDTDFTNKGTKNPITGLEKGSYSVYAIAYDKAGNPKQSTNTVENVKISTSYSNVTAKMVEEHPETYYGLKVTNYTSVNGQNDWRIFYSDGTHIFLITGDYIDTTKTNRVDTMATGMSTNRYRVYWDSMPTFQDLDSTSLIRFKATESKLNDTTNNSKYVSTLLNTNNWKKYLDKENGTGNAEYAVGGPTIEMWLDSWNTKYPNDKLYRKACTSHPGYYIGTSENISESLIYTSIDELRDKVGYNNKLYFPHISSYNDGYNDIDGYWVSSPNVYVNSIFYIRYNGSINGTISYENKIGIRPVVSLKSGTTINAVESE